MADLGYWKTHQEAIMACEKHASQNLIFNERWRGFWKASATGHSYGITTIAG